MEMKEMLTLINDMQDLGFEVVGETLVYGSGSWATYTKATVSFTCNGSKAYIEYEASLWDGGEIEGKTSTQVSVPTNCLVSYLQQHFGFRSKKELERAKARIEERIKLRWEV